MGPISEGHLTARVFESENDSVPAVIEVSKSVACTYFTKIENFSSISSA
jgi:hypothetical protein